MIKSWDGEGQGQGGQMRNGMVKRAAACNYHVWPLCKQPLSFCFV
jgi:hypothetical protein